MGSDVKLRLGLFGFYCVIDLDIGVRRQWERAQIVTKYDLNDFVRSSALGSYQHQPQTPD